MKIEEALEYLEYYQYKYRRGEVSIREIDPKKLGMALDIAIEVLRKHPSLTHNQEFFREVEVPPLIARSASRINRLGISVKFIINSDQDICRMAYKLGIDIVSFFKYCDYEYPKYIAINGQGCTREFSNEKEWLECSYLYLE